LGFSPGHVGSVATAKDWLGLMLSATKADDPADAYAAFERVKA
jgi:hypothetical protein